MFYTLTNRPIGPTGKEVLLTILMRRQAPTVGHSEPLLNEGSFNHLKEGGSSV
jgi:hypothetical protein